MDHLTTARLLEPFLPEPLSPAQLNNISTYIDILLRWNTRINLTAIRNPEEIVIRHFGESFFCAQKLAAGHLAPGSSVIDLGSGAGFPGLPIKIFAPEISLTLIESKQKKVAFLREVVRSLNLSDATVFPGRAEEFIPSSPNNLVTFRAVERFAAILPIALRLPGPEGSLALLIGEDQIKSAHELSPGTLWHSPIPIPLSQRRVLLTSH